VTGAVEAGVGVRAIAGEGTGYAYTCDPSLDALLAAAGAAGRIASGLGGAAGSAPFRADRTRSADVLEEGGAGWEPSPEEVAASATYLEAVDLHARRCDPRVTEVNVSLSEESRCISVLNSEGMTSRDDQILTGVTASVYVHSGGSTQVGRHGGGARRRLEDLASGPLHPRAVAEEAVRRASVLLDAVDAPAGEWPVVIGNGWGGVLLHEAIGHGFEADFVRRGTSIYAGRMGQKVAAALCTVVDDGSIDGLRGSFRIDDEGSRPRRTVLVEKGVLAGYLHDLLSANALGMEPTGNGRRHSFRTPPIPRQSNIFMEGGDDSPEEILRAVPRGLYARTLGGEQVDIVNGNFVFQVTEGYLIEDGRVTAPVRGANLIGTGHEVLGRVTRVGSDFAFDPGIGVCGKDGQSQPVGVGQPTVLVAALTVGGTRL